MTRGFSTKLLAYTAVMTAMVAVMTMVGITLPAGFVNFGDTMIYITASLFGPIPAMLAGGIGSFLADLAVYPMTMWFTLVIKGVEGLIAGLLIKYVMPLIVKEGARKGVKILVHTACVTVAGIWMAGGYFLTQALFWGAEGARLTGALTQLPWDILQQAVSITLSVALLYLLRLKEIVKIDYLSKTSSGAGKHADKGGAESGEAGDGGQDGDTDGGEKRA